MDGTISMVYNHMQMPNGSPLPESVLLVDPGTSCLLSLGDETDAQTNVVDLDLERRELVLIPVNNTATGAVDSGDHWTLLVAWRCGTRTGAPVFAIHHVDSLWRRAAASFECARRIAARVFGPQTTLQAAQWV